MPLFYVDKKLNLIIFQGRKAYLTIQLIMFRNSCKSMIQICWIHPSSISTWLC